MLTKLAKAFSLLRQEVTALKGDVQRIEKVRQVVQHGKDGVSPDPDEIVSAVLEKIPTPKDGVSPDPQAIAEAAAKLIPEPKPGRDAVPPTVRDVADVVLAKIEKPKDGVSPDPKAIAEAAAKLLPVPKDGVSPTAEEVAKKMPSPQRGKTGAPGKNGVSVTDVQLNNNELFVFLDGKKKKAGKIKMPAASAPFRPGAGDGGGARTNPPFYNKQVVVRKAAQLSGELRSDVLYFLDGVIDFTGTGFQIEVPVGGLSLAGHTFDVSGLKCDDDDYTLFTSPVGGSGNLLGMDYFLDVNGTNSQVYDLTDATGFNAFEFQRINYNNCSSLGEITGYRQGLEEGTGRFGGKPELTLSGTWLGGFFIDVSIVRGLADGAYSLFKAGPGFLMNSRFRSNQNIDLPASASFFDFSAANFANPSTVQLVGCLVSRNGVTDSSDPNIIPNLGPGELASEWLSNNGIGNTFVGGELNIATEVLTPIAAANTFTDLLGTYTASDLQHFDEPANGQLRHLGESPVEYSVGGQLVIEGGSNDLVDLKVVVFRSATTSFEDGKTVRRVINNLQGARNVGYFLISDNITLNQNDYVKMQVANATDATDVTAELDSFIRVSAR